MPLSQENNAVPVKRRFLSVKRTISKETKEEAFRLYTTMKVNQKEIASKLSISTASVSKAIKEIASGKAPTSMVAPANTRTPTPREKAHKRPRSSPGDAQNKRTHQLSRNLTPISQDFSTSTRSQDPFSNSNSVSNSPILSEIGSLTDRSLSLQL